MSKADGQPENLLNWMEALGNADRLRILRLLERNELGVVELSDVLQLPQSTISRHLKILSKEAWVRSRKQGTTHLSRLPIDELAPPQKKLWQLTREQMQSWTTTKQDDLRLKRRLEDRHAASQQFFTGAAGEWDKLRQQYYGEAFTTPALLSLLPSHYVVADLGCGTGQFILRLAPFVQRVIGVDNTPAMLRAAGKLLATFDNVELKPGDLESLPIETETCDAAIISLALSYVPDTTPVLAELSRILKPAGRAVIVDATSHDREEFRREMGQTRLGFDARELTELLSEAGFTDVRYTALPPEPSVKGPALFLASAERR